MVKSPDAFRTIREVAEWLDTPAHVLRFWESRFPQVKPVKRAGGRRYYRPSDMELLGGIKQLLHEDGLTIRGVQKLLREQGVRYVAAKSQPLDLEPALGTSAAEPWDATSPDVPPAGSPDRVGGVLSPPGAQRGLEVGAESLRPACPGESAPACPTAVHRKTAPADEGSGTEKGPAPAALEPGDKVAMPAGEQAAQEEAAASDATSGEEEAGRDGSASPARPPEGVPVLAPLLARRRSGMPPRGRAALERARALLDSMVARD